MGRLVGAETGEGIELASETMLGRSRQCFLRISDARVSSRHALITWSGTGWLVRDLGSRNGSWVDGVFLPPGQLVALRSGAEIALGDGTLCWVLADDSAPPAIAWSEQSGAIRRAKNGVLTLPEDDAPTAIVAQQPDGRWSLEVGQDTRPTVSGELVVAGGVPWRLFLPIGVPMTEQAAASSIRSGVLTLAVSRDEEQVEATWEVHGQRVSLRPRTHHYMLLTLARVRLSDQQEGVSDTEAGWLDRDQLCGMLRITPNRLKVDIHRARQELVAAGFLDADQIIERRRTSRQVRIGVEDLVLAAL